MHAEVMGRDGDALRKFYGDMFGWPIEKVPGGEFDYGIVNVEKMGQGIGAGVGSSPQGNEYVTFYVQVPDLQAALDKAESLGGKTVMPPVEMEMVSVALFKDSEGHLIGLVKG
jgi:uncharacterized protein